MTVNDWDRFVLPEISKNVDVTVSSLEEQKQNYSLLEKEMSYYYHIGIRELALPQPEKNNHIYANNLLHVIPALTSFNPLDQQQTGRIH